jgi:hypothetical protein
VVLASVHPAAAGEPTVEYITFAPDIAQSTNRQDKHAKGGSRAKAGPTAASGTGAETGAETAGALAAEGTGLADGAVAAPATEWKARAAAEGPNDVME